jgi:hypothetical protein
MGSPCSHLASQACCTTAAAEVVSCVRASAALALGTTFAPDGEVCWLTGGPRAAPQCRRCRSVGRSSDATARDARCRNEVRHRVGERPTYLPVAVFRD